MLRVVLTNQAFRSFEKLRLPSVQARAGYDLMCFVLDSLDDSVEVSEIFLLNFFSVVLFPTHQHHYL